MNWRGRPLTSHDVVVNSIAATTTRTGLTVHAELDDGAYPTGIKVSDAQMAALPAQPPRLPRRLELHPAPRRGTPPAPRSDQERRRERHSPG